MTAQPGSTRALSSDAGSDPAAVNRIESSARSLLAVRQLRLTDFRNYRQLRLDCGLEPVVLFNGIDVAAYRDAEPWGTSGPTVLFLGRDEPRKGRSVLLEAAEQLDPRVTVWVTGTAPAGWQPGSGAIVEFLGIVSDEEKRRRLRGASVLCAPSLGGESFGIILLEAMAAGVAVVCSDIDGYRQALDGCGTLVAPGDPSELAASIASALVEPPVGGIERGRQRAQQWSLGTLAARYEVLYDEAISASLPRRSG